MPRPNFHSCRIRPPGAFERIRTIKRGGLTILIGRLKGKKTTTAQSILYPKLSWSADRAKAHCSRRGGRFEAATKT